MQIFVRDIQSTCPRQVGGWGKTLEKGSSDVLLWALSITYVFRDDCLNRDNCKKQANIWKPVLQMSRTLLWWGQWLRNWVQTSIRKGRILKQISTRFGGDSSLEKDVRSHSLTQPSRSGLLLEDAAKQRRVIKIARRLNMSQFWVKNRGSAARCVLQDLPHFDQSTRPWWHRLLNVFYPHTLQRAANSTYCIPHQRCTVCTV